MERRVLCILLVALAATESAGLQAHEHGPQQAPVPQATEQPTPAPEGRAHAAEVETGLRGPLEVPMNREGSGTAWQPDSTPMLGHHLSAGDWALMLHYNVFAGYDAQSSGRGDRDFVSTNWVMLMAQRPALGGQLTGRVMLSAEPFTTEGARGYPLLLQSGETAGGAPLHDRQHPHDLFMELSATYRRELGDRVGLELYVAPSGEPALGPVAYPHRYSAMWDPFAALGHHWEDSTHIAFGVVTAGLFTRFAKLEGSWFNGREPDEGRYDLDLRVPDSWSGRLSVNPTGELSGQLSYGFLRSPEALEPDVSVRRLTASATYNRPLGSGGNWATTALWGRNAPTTDAAATNAFLLETSLQRGANTFFGRGELVQKTGHDLVLDPDQEHEVFPVGVVAIGYLRRLGEWGGVVPAVGVRGAVNFIGSELEPFYGSRRPLGGMLFLQLRPGRMTVHDPSLEGHGR